MFGSPGRAASTVPASCGKGLWVVPGWEAGIEVRHPVEHSSAFPEGTYAAAPGSAEVSRAVRPKHRDVVPPAGRLRPPVPEPPFSRRSSATEGRPPPSGKLPTPAVDSRVSPLLLCRLRPAAVDENPPNTPSTRRSISQQPPSAPNIPPPATSCSQRGVMD